MRKIPYFSVQAFLDPVRILSGFSGENRLRSGIFPAGRRSGGAFRFHGRRTMGNAGERLREETVKRYSNAHRDGNPYTSIRQNPTRKIERSARYSHPRNRIPASGSG